MQYGVTSGESHFLETSYVSFIYVDIMESQQCRKKGKGDGLPQFTGGIEEAKSQFFTVWHFDVILGLDPLPSARPLETGMISSQSFGFARVPYIGCSVLRLPTACCIVAIHFHVSKQLGKQLL